MTLYDYVYGSERTTYYNFEQDLSNPRPVDWAYYPPTFITYVVNPEKLHDYIEEVIDEKTPDIIQKVDKEVPQWGAFL